MLYRSGLIDLTQDILKEETIVDNTKVQHLRDARHAHLRVIVNDRIKIHYDTHDSWEIDMEYLSETDYYFKRSFSPQRLQNLGEQRNKVHPLGLNYAVYPSSLDRFAIERNLVLVHGKRKLYEIIRSLRFTTRVHNMWSFPDYDAAPKILFMVKAWDPHNHPDRLSEKVDERMHINEVRANCIKMLRNHFGNHFYGGFIHADFTVKNYKAFLMPDNTLSSKRNYLRLLKSHPICVATMGLHESIGWKFAEYIAFSKAVLSEKLIYEVSGNLKKDINYLEFASPEDCVEKAERLFSDSKLRNYLMTNNAMYYHSYLRPDSLILNTIFTALSEL